MSDKPDPSTSGSPQQEPSKPPEPPRTPPPPPRTPPRGGLPPRTPPPPPPASPPPPEPERLSLGQRLARFLRTLIFALLVVVVAVAVIGATAFFRFGYTADMLSGVGTNGGSSTNLRQQLARLEATSESRNQRIDELSQTIATLQAQSDNTMSTVSNIATIQAGQDEQWQQLALQTERIIRFLQLLGDISNETSRELEGQATPSGEQPSEEEEVMPTVTAIIETVVPPLSTAMPEPEASAEPTQAPAPEEEEAATPTSVSSPEPTESSEEEAATPTAESSAPLETNPLQQTVTSLRETASTLRTAEAQEDE